MNAATLQMTLSSPLGSAAKAATDTFHCRDYLPTCARPPLRLLFLDNRHLHRHHHSFFCSQPPLSAPLLSLCLVSVCLPVFTHCLLFTAKKKEREDDDFR